MDVPLDDILRSRSHVRVLRALHRLPDGMTVSGRDVARRAGLSPTTAGSALFSLVDLGVARVRRIRGIDLFELNRAHVLAGELVRLFEREEALFEELVRCLRTQLAATGAPVSAAFVFGSAARREMTTTSDVDLALICASDDELAEVEEAAIGPVHDAVRERFGSRLNVVVGFPSLDSLRSPEREGNRLWDQIAREGVPVLDAHRREMQHGATKGTKDARR